MLHIILLILKIIGIILLSLLGIVLLAVCCALFIPIRYRIEILREEGEGKPPAVVRASITWLLHLINIHIRYPAEVYVKVRLLLFTLFRLPKAQKKPGKAAQKSSAKEEHKISEQRNGQNPAVTSSIAENNDADPPDKPVIENRPGNPEGSDSDRDAPEIQEPEAAGFLQKIWSKVQNLLEKIKQIVQKLKAIFENIKYTIRHRYDKMKSTLDTIQYYRAVIESEAFRQSWTLCSKQFGIILRELKPDKFETDLVVGMEDPAATGNILALCGLLYPVIGPDLKVTGDFERARIEGRIYIKGDIRAFTFLRIAVKIYRSKDIKILIKLLKKEAV